MAFVSKGEMNTDLAKKLKAIFDRSAGRRYAAFAEQKKKDKKKDSDAATGEHVDANVLPKGILGKFDGYAQNGSDYLRSKNGRGVYRNFSHKYLEHIRDLVRQVAEFPGGPAENFDPSAKDKNNQPAQQQWPYAWEAHHIIPGSAYYYVNKINGKEEHVFTYQQYRLILASDYNINHGHNIIMLPNDGWAVPVHALIQHKGDHPQYTQKVMQALRDLAQDIQEKIAQKQPHKALVADIFEQLKDLEDDFWDFLLKLSRSLVDALTEGQDFVHDHVRFEPKKGKTKYEWGALY